MSAAAAPLAADLEAALRRLKLAAVRRLAPEVLLTARTQRWPPEELLLTLLEAELAARDASNARARLRAAGFRCKGAGRVRGRRELAAAGDVRLAGHTRVDPGQGEPGAGRAGRHGQEPSADRPRPRRRRDRPACALLRRRGPGRDALPGSGRQQRRAADRGPAALRPGDRRRPRLAPLDDVGAQLLFRFVAAAYERRALGVASHWPFESWGRFLPEHTSAVALLDRLLHHSVTVVTSGDSYRMKEARARGGGPTARP